MPFCTNPAAGKSRFFLDMIADKTQVVHERFWICKNLHIDALQDKPACPAVKHHQKGIMDYTLAAWLNPGNHFVRADKVGGGL